MLLKKIAGIAFAIAFLMAIVLFTGTGREYISFPTAKYVFMASGAVGLFLNLLSFQHGQQNSIFNFLYWLGSIVLFVGLIFLLMHWPYGFYIIVAGLTILGISFVFPEKWLGAKSEDSDLLDS